MLHSHSHPDFTQLTNRLPSRIVVTGSHGQLGARLCQLLGDKAMPLNSQQIHLEHPESVLPLLLEMEPQAIINTAAYSAVDRAEATDEQRSCNTINAASVGQLALASRRLDCPLVQISTDYLFVGDPSVSQPFREDTPCNPQGDYARSKLAGEKAAADSPHPLIVRTCGIYGPQVSASSLNFVTTMLQLASTHTQVRVVNDQMCSPTWVYELALAVLHLLSIQARGIYHVVNEGGVTWFDFARTVFQLANRNTEVIPITTAEYGAAAPRPAYSALSIEKYRVTNGPPMSTWHDALRKFLAQHLAGR